MKNIIIHCEARKLRNGNRNPKNYPWWPELLNELKDYNFIQIGIEGDTQYTDDFRKNLSFKELKKLTLECDSWISIDSFFQHFAWDLKKPGVCIIGYSDPNIFGHPENLNIVDRSKLRPHQFQTWEEVDYNEEVYENAKDLAEKIKNFINSLN